MNPIIFLVYLLALPVVFIVYRKFEFAIRVRKARSHGDCHVQRPILIGVLERWIKRQPLDVNFYTTLFRKHGRTFTSHPFLTPLLMTTDPENVKAILATQFGEFDIGSTREEMGQKYMRKGVFTTQGSDWHHSRSYLRPAFNKATYVGLDYIEDHFQKLLQNVPKDGRAFDIQPLFFEYTLNTISNMLFGISVKDLGYTNEDMRAFHDAEHCMRVKGFRGLHLSFLSKNLARLYRSPEMDKAAKVFEKFVNDMLTKGMERYHMQEKKSDGSRYVFLHDAMDRTHNLDRFKDEASNVLFAGRDTGAVLMSNIFFTLARNPEMWEKLQSEVEELNGHRPSYETLKNMRYLNNVIREANRMFPVVPFNYREALVDTTLPHGGGLHGTSPLFICRGTYVVYCTYAMHRDLSIYGPDADHFKPERWEDPSLRPGWGFLPFNGGPRICLGQNLAITEMSYTIVRLLQEFQDIHSCDPLPFKPSTNFVMSNVNGAWISLVKRE